MNHRVLSFKNAEDIGKLQRAASIVNALHSQKKIRLCRLIGLNPGITQSELICYMNEPQSSGSQYLTKMVNETLLVVCRDGKSSRYFLSNKFHKVKEGIVKFSMSYE